MIDREKLKYYRELNHLDYKQLSKRLNCPKGVIASWETGERSPLEKDMVKLCSLYGIEKKDLYIKEENKPPERNKDEKKVSAPTYALVFLLSLVYGTMADNTGVICVLLITNPILITIIYKLKAYKRDKKSKRVKSLFGFLLSNDLEERKKLYFYEASTIAGIYILLNVLFRLFKMNFLLVNAKLLKNRSINEFIILLISYLLLTALAFIIELRFGEYMLKQEIEVQK